MALARTKRSKLDSTRTLRDADFLSIESWRKYKPFWRALLSAEACTCERNRAGEKDVDESRNRFPIKDEMSDRAGASQIRGLTYVVSNLPVSERPSTLAGAPRFQKFPVGQTRPSAQYWWRHLPTFPSPGGCFGVG